MPGFWWSLISAALAVLAGLILLAQPAQGTLTLTIVVGAYFLAEGVATIMYALEHRRELSGRWSWMLVAGLMESADCSHHHHGIAGICPVGDRPFGRRQFAIWRSGADRRGARRAQRLIAQSDQQPRQMLLSLRSSSASSRFMAASALGSSFSGGTWSARGWR